MGLASVTLADGAGAAASITDGATVRVTPGNALVIALASSTGIQRWDVRADNAGIFPANGPTPSDGKGFAIIRRPGDTFSVTFNAPQADCMIPLTSSVFDGIKETHCVIFLDCRMVGKVVPIYRARGVCTSNMSLTAFVGVSGGTPQDGVTYAQGDVVLLSTQTSTIANGLYTVGLVGGGTAPLTRISNLNTGDVVQGGILVEVSEGTVHGNSRWKLTTTGNITIGTTAHAWYPEKVRGQITLAAGTSTISCPVLSITQSVVVLHRITATATNSTYGGYHPTTGGVTGLTAGVQGTGAAIVQSCVVAGTIANTDTSLLQFCVINF